VSDTEIKEYWHQGAWGNPMADIEPERGLWASKGHFDKPVRITKRVS
jgi:hypothetical protein